MADQKDITMQRAEVIHTANANKLLKGKRIVSVRYMTNKEKESYYWGSRGIIFMLEDKTLIIVSMDDEGNGPGALLTNNADIPIIPIL